MKSIHKICKRWWDQPLSPIERILLILVNGLCIGLGIAAGVAYLLIL